MEISMMVAQLKSEAESVENELQTKIAREKTLRLSLAALESEIKAVTDKTISAYILRFVFLINICPPYH